MLTEAQLAQYHEDGFIIPDFRLEQTTLHAIQELHNQLIERYPQFSDYCPALLPLEKGFLEFARNDTILDMVSQILGDNIALWNSSFFAKPAKVGSKTPWHQDGEYWPMRPLATCTVWIAVDNSTTENGCLRVIRGSHKNKQLLRHQTNNGPGLALNQELSAGEFDESKAVDLVMEAGQISLHDVYLAHGSEPNLSAQPRRGMTLRFMPTSSQYDRNIEKRQNQQKVYSWANNSELSRMQRLPLFLMRGVDLFGGNEFEDVRGVSPRGK